MKNYILLGIGIGMIISGSIFTYFENKEYRNLEEVIREEVSQELAREKAYEKLEKELESYVIEEKKAVEVVGKQEIKEEKVEEVKAEVKEEVKKVALSKFKPIDGQENTYSIQFRSSSKKADVERIQKELGGIIDTEIRFIQGFYRLLAKDLYSREYSEIIAHEIRQEFKLNPVVRSEKQMDYLVLGPKKYNEKYGIVEEKEEIKEVIEKQEIKEEKIEATEKIEVEKIEVEKIEEALDVELIEEEKVEEVTDNVDKESSKVVEENPNRIESGTITITKLDSVEKVVTEAAITSEAAITTDVSIEVGEKVEDIEEVENLEEAKGNTEEVEETIKDIRLVFVESGSLEEYKKVEESIKDLIQVEVEQDGENYTVKSKEQYSEVVADNLIEKLRLLFNLDVEKEKNSQ